MSLLHQKSWSGKNLPHWVVTVRIVLGLCLIYKGVDFIMHKDQLITYFAEVKSLKNVVWLIGIIPWIHIIGGLMIIVGLLTRFMSVIQIPFLIGAVVFANMREGDHSDVSELPFAFLILVLVIVFCIEGGGYLSLDNYLRKPVNELEEEEDEEELLVEG